MEDLRKNKLSRGKGASIKDLWQITYPEELPIVARRAEIIEAIRAHPVVIIAGETGSGKTTQLPKLCLEAGSTHIGCTQPRRVAALSISKRVAQELHVQWGKEVGCKIRFSDKTAPETVIKFMTDGILLAEVQGDPQLKAYDTLIIDEAHERSLNIDFLLGHLNQLRHQRPDLKIIITSATIDTNAFSRAFANAPIIEVSGRTFPVETIYSPIDELAEDSGDFTLIDAVVESVKRIFKESPSGDILIFLPTERDIREVTDLLYDRLNTNATILPLFGRLSSGDQQRIFTQARTRKIVVSTNIAETSLTIPGIHFVIDTGDARVSRFNPRTRTKRLPIEPISQSSANQRKGRCGRIAKGICIRLYSEEDFLKRAEFTPPEILRSNLAEVILRMKASHLGEIETFPFIDPPLPHAIRAGYQLLVELGAIDKNKHLTPLGKNLAKLPVDPTVGRMILQALHERALPEVLIIASALSIQDPRDRPLEAKEAADQAHRKFIHPQSDLLTLFNIWSAYHDKCECMTQRKLRKFCKSHFLSYIRMREWRDVHAQLKGAISQSAKGKSPSSHQKSSFDIKDEPSWKFGGKAYQAIHRSLLPGLLVNIAYREEGNIFRAASDRKVMMFPGSGLFEKKALKPLSGSQKKKPAQSRKRKDWIIAAEIVETNRLYARTTARIDPQWAVELGEHICKSSYSEPTYTPESARVLVKESIRIHGLEIGQRRIGYGTLNPEHATEIFIRSALVNDTLKGPLPFLEHNRSLRKKIEVIQTRLRSSDYLNLDEALYRFYSRHLKDISSIHELNRFCRGLNLENKKCLYLKESDLLSKQALETDRSAFPEKVSLKNSALPLTYTYKPGEEDDGATLSLSPKQAREMQKGMIDWLIPGHLEEKVLHLLRNLPKHIRVKLFPIPEKIEKITRDLKPTHHTLIESLSSYLKNEYDIETIAEDWHAETLPDHLKVRLKVVNSENKAITASRDFGQIQEALDQQEKKASLKNKTIPWKKVADEWENPSLSTWEIDSLPERIEITQAAGIPVYAYPGLRVEGETVALRLFRDPSAAKEQTTKGITQLLSIDLRYELAWLKKDLKELSKLGLLAITLTPLETLKQQTYLHIHRFLCQRSVHPLTREAYQKTLATAKDESKGLLYRFIDQLESILSQRDTLLHSTNPYPGLKEDIERLTPSDFLLHTPFQQLKHFTRYFKAISIRLERARLNVSKDAEKVALIRPYDQRLAKEMAAVTDSSSTLEALNEIRWMIEEFRVSLFAQEQGTAHPISAVRLDKKFAALAATSIQK
ncbi:MAG: ATP-dependent RNA helicase HrpA [Opitutaceae bacterium]|nr:ATP-dependent RNA helicase HrpA [Opitutaceae bacterium]